ncbi:hypothetical protein ACFLZU_03575 [Thermodesulfobacteriota bacterium]
MKHFSSMILLILLFVTLPPNEVSASSEVGWIEGFSGRVDYYRIERNNKSFEPVIYKSLNNGDKVFVLFEGGVLALALADGTSVSVTKKTSPYIVQCGVTTETKFSKLLAWVGGRIEEWYVEKEDNSTRVETLTRKNNSVHKPPFWPSFWVEDDLRIIEGKYPLSISWREGKGPFNLKIYRLQPEGKNQVVYATRKEEGQRLTTDSLEFASGENYIMEISDVGEVWSWNISVHSEDELPKNKDIPSKHKSSDLLNETLYAVWLIDRHPEWLYVSYQRLAQMANEYLPARRLRDALEKDERP